jgi:hypothetical protein
MNSKSSGMRRLWSGFARQRVREFLLQVIRVFTFHYEDDVRLANMAFVHTNAGARLSASRPRGETGHVRLSEFRLLSDFGFRRFGFISPSVAPLQ